MASANPVEPRGPRRRERGVSVIAHRGFAGRYPENTVPAVEHSTREDRADAVELDVYPTADGELVVFHDETPRRLTDAPESIADTPVWELPAATLADLDVLGTGRGVPRLSTALAAVPPSVPVNLEFKHPGAGSVAVGEHLDPDRLAAARSRWRPVAEQVLAVAAETDHDLLVSSFCEGALAAVRDLDPSVPVATVVFDSAAAGLAVARRHDCEAIHVPRSAVPGTPFYGEDYPVPGDFEGVDVLAAATGEGRAVHAWTVTDWHQATALARAGVDGLIADYPGLLAFRPGGQ